MIRFKVNGEEREGREGMTLPELLAELELGYKRLAVEINEDVVPKTIWDDQKIQDGDRIEIVSFVGGG